MYVESNCFMEAPRFLPPKIKGDILCQFYGTHMFLFASRPVEAIDILQPVTSIEVCAPQTSTEILNNITETRVHGKSCEDNLCDDPRLTIRQRQILSLLIKGKTNKNTALTLGISRRTVESHRAVIMKKTGARSFPALINKALAGAEVFVWKHVAVKNISTLTPRQRHVMELVLLGHPSKNIASDLNISLRTVENHRAVVMKKTGARSLSALACLALVAA